MPCPSQATTPPPSWKVAELLDVLGYDAADIGTLSDSWRSEPDTPVYCQPYFPGQPPEQASPHAAFRWFFETPGVAVSAGRVKELTDRTVRGPAGGQLDEAVTAAAGFDATSPSRQIRPISA